MWAVSVFLKKRFSDKYVNSTLYKKRKLTDVSDVVLRWRTNVRLRRRTNKRNLSKFSLFIQCRIYIIITKLYQKFFGLTFEIKLFTINLPAGWLKYWVDHFWFQFVSLKKKCFSRLIEPFSLWLLYQLGNFKASLI